MGAAIQFVVDKDSSWVFVGLLFLAFGLFEKWDKIWPALIAVTAYLKKRYETASGGKVFSILSIIALFVGGIAYDVTKDLFKDAAKEELKRLSTRPTEIPPPVEPNVPPSARNTPPDTTASIGCLPEASASAAFKTMRAMPKSAWTARFSSVFADKQICPNGWIGTVDMTPRKDVVTGEWITPLIGGVELRSKDDVWGAVQDGQRLRYSGRLVALTDQEILVIADAKFVQRLPTVVPKAPPPPPPEPTYLEKLLGKQKQ